MLERSFLVPGRRSRSGRRRTSSIEARRRCSRQVGSMVRQALHMSVSAFGPWHRSWQAGQMYMQAPHSRHSSERMSKGVEILRLVPRFWKPMARPSICSAHIRTQSPQKTHSSFRGLNRSWVTPNFEARSWIFLELGAVDKHELDHHPPRLDHPLRVRPDDQAFFHRVGAGGDELGRRGLPDLDQAEPAPAVGAQTLVSSRGSESRGRRTGRPRECVHPSSASTSRPFRMNGIMMFSFAYGFLSVFGFQVAAQATAGFPDGPSSVKPFSTSLKFFVRSSDRADRVRPSAGGPCDLLLGQHFRRDVNTTAG